MIDDSVEEVVEEEFVENDNEEEEDTLIPLKEYINV